MNFDELQKFVDGQHARFRRRKKYSRREEILARSVKLGEEYGELCDEVLASLGDHRKEKMEKQRDISGEFADVIIVVFMLAKAMKIDVSRALTRKVEVIKRRNRRRS